MSGNQQNTVGTEDGAQVGAQDQEDNDSEIDAMEMLELQLSEVELLESMYSKLGEFQYDDKIAINDIKRYVNGQLHYDHLHTRIGFIIETIDEHSNKVEIMCRLAHEYPAIYPEIFVRSENLSKAGYRNFNDALFDYIQSMDHGEICLCQTVQWILDNLQNFVEPGNENIVTLSNKADIDTTFSRLWIYSHHIYSKTKRKDILEMASELKLTGFSLPGKPGVICIEGYSLHVEEFWQRIRRMCWKRLMIKEKEDCELDGKDIDEFRKFGKFEEKNFSPRSGKAREYHMDLGMLYQFLEERQCSHIFSLYFGVDGQKA